MTLEPGEPVVWTDPHWWWPFKIWEVPNEGQESIVGELLRAVNWGKGGGGGGGLSSSRIA